MEALPAVTQKEFILQFQKLVCLDYIIRNTGKYNNLLCNVKLFFKIQGAAKNIGIIRYISYVEKEPKPANEPLTGSIRRKC